MGGKGVNRILLILAALITTLVVYVVVSLWVSDETESISPGWHTTIYPPGITWLILTAKILVQSLFVYLIFRGTTKLLTVFWTKKIKD